jgi:hypothetical protein
MKSKRQSTVEPVFGTLTQFMGLRKINTLGIAQANKVMHLSAMAYNLKKYLKFVQKQVKTNAKALGFLFMEIGVLQKWISFNLRPLKLIPLDPLELIMRVQNLTLPVLWVF